MNDLVTFESSDIAELADILGTTTGGSAPDLFRVPELSINSKSRDKATKKSIPEGYFYLKNADQVFYAETATFRPLASHIQYFHWGEVEGKRKLICKSRAVKNAKDEARDTLGGIACGTPPWEVQKEMDYEEAKKWRDMKHRVVRGLVSMSGETINGKEMSVENQPCILFLKNSTYGGFYHEFIKKIPKGRNLHEYQATLSSEYQENGSVTWYTYKYDLDLSSTLPLTQEVYDTMKVFAETIKKENDWVDQKYFEALRSDALDEKAINAIGDSLDDDFEDVA